MIQNFDEVCVFTATKGRDRAELGRRVTEWLKSHPQARVVDKVVTQSSDAEFHCLSITLFVRNRRNSDEYGQDNQGNHSQDGNLRRRR